MTKPTPIPEGSRVQLHPATDWWMRGAKYGDVVMSNSYYVWVRLDTTGRTIRFPVRDILEVISK